MTTMIERVARAIEPAAFQMHDSMRDYCLRNGDSEEEAKATANWAHGGEVKRALERARAALEAMKEPTEAMLKAGDVPGWDDSVSIGLSGEVWSAMITAALDE